jgi:phospholipase D1/2
MTEVGQGLKIITRKFARDLRMNQWKKHLGMLVDQTTTGVQKEVAAPNGINIEQPLTEATIKAIQQLAKQNRDAYSEVFLHTPRDSFHTITEGRERAFPLLSGKKNQHDFSGWPTLQPDFMKTEDFLKKHPIPAKAKNIELENRSSLKKQNDDTGIKIKIHDAEKATLTLRTKVKGFWCEMPLDWGSKEKQTPQPPVSSKMIAVNEHMNDRSTEKNAV